MEISFTHAQIVNRLSAAYTRALIQNPNDSVADNIRRAVNECPDIVLACNVHEELLKLVKRFADYLWDDEFEGVGQAEALIAKLGPH